MVITAALSRPSKATKCMNFILTLPPFTRISRKSPFVLCTFFLSKTYAPSYNFIKNSKSIINSLIARSIQKSLQYQLTVFDLSNLPLGAVMFLWKIYSYEIFSWAVCFERLWWNFQVLMWDYLIFSSMCSIFYWFLLPIKQNARKLSPNMSRASFWLNLRYLSYLLDQCCQMKCL